MKLSNKTLDLLRSLPHAQIGRSGDILSVPMARYYATNQFYTRANRWRKYGGNRSPDAWYCDQWPALRDCGPASDFLTYRAAIGFYSDPWFDSVVSGRVFQLPARHGVKQFIAGIESTGYDVKTLYIGEIFDDPKDAAMRAQEYAERVAESDLECAAKDAADQDIERLHDEARDAIKSFCALKHELHADLSPHIHAVVADTLRRYRNEVSDAMKRVRALRDNFWLAVED